jgi:hypothetical protein
MEQTLFLSSAEASVKNLASGHCRFNFREPIEITEGSFLACTNFTFINDFTNIETGVNDTIHYTDDAKTLNKYVITIPEGNYGLSDLTNFLDEFQLANAPNLAIFTLTPNYATGKIGILFNTAAYWVEFPATGPFDLLGFTTGQTVPDVVLVPGGSTINMVEYGPNQADFNTVTLVRLATSITHQSIMGINRSGVIIQSPPISDPLTINSYEPTHINRVEILIGGKLNSISLNCYDQNGDELKMLEDFSCVLKITSS